MKPINTDNLEIKRIVYLIKLHIAINAYLNIMLDICMKLKAYHHYA